MSPASTRARLATCAPLLVSLVAAAAGCRPEAAPAPDVRCLEVVRDLLDTPGPAPPHRPQALAVRVEAPASAVLRAEARAKPLPGATVPRVELTVTIDGTVRERRELEVGPGPTMADFELPLPAGREVEVRLDAEPHDAVAFWRRATVERVATVPRRPAAAGPDLLLVVVDTLRADHCGPYGATRPTTPNLDRLAAAGITVEDAVAQGPWTVPSVATLFTGLYPGEHGLVAGTERLDWRRTTLAERLQRRGVTTVGVSANRLVGPSKQLDQGFERFRLLHQARAGEVVAAYLELLDGLPAGQRFSYLHFMDPHTPYNPPPETADRFADPGYDGPYRDPRALDRAWSRVGFGRAADPPLTRRDLDHLRARYDEEILAWDLAFGRLLDRLAADGVLDRTLVVVTSDHGEEFLDHGMLKHGRQLYRESTRVPLVLRPPGGAAAAARVAGPYELRRLGELLLAAADGDLELRARLERDSGTAYSAASRQVAPQEPWPRERLASVQVGSRKRIEWLDEDRAEAYDLVRDPAENGPLDGAEPTTLADALATWLGRTGGLPESEGAEIDDSDLEDLRALGYLQ